VEVELPVVLPTLRSFVAINEHGQIVGSSVMDSLTASGRVQTYHALLLAEPKADRARAAGEPVDRVAVRIAPRGP
jgi:hypothetical protein